MRVKNRKEKKNRNNYWTLCTVDQAHEWWSSLSAKRTGNAGTSNTLVYKYGSTASLVDFLCMVCVCVCVRVCGNALDTFLFELSLAKSQDLEDAHEHCFPNCQITALQHRV